MPLFMKFVPKPARRGLPLWTLEWSATDSLNATGIRSRVGFNVRCAPGYQTTAGQTRDSNAPGTCAACKPGFRNFPKDIGLKAYDQTPPPRPDGRFENECVPCPKGYFQDAYGSTDCKISPANSFQPFEGASAALKCPDNDDM